MMDFERFDKLARTDRVTLLTALELLWQNGRMMIQTEDVSALIAACVAGIGGFYTTEKLREVVTACKELASLETAELIRCLRCNSMKMKAPGADEEGICPICGGKLEYGDDEPLDDGGVYEWTCLHSPRTTGMRRRNYSDPAKLRWYPDISCPVCDGEVNSWDKRCSRALGYQAIVCEACISEEYGIDVEELRGTMKNHFGLIPCPGI